MASRQSAKPPASPISSFGTPSIISCAKAKSSARATAAAQNTRPEFELRWGDFHDVRKGLLAYGAVDHLIVDPPFSVRTHHGHNSGSAPTGRRVLSYDPWDRGDVLAACEAFDVATGWIVVMTDHVLAPTWEAGLRMIDRYVFAPLPVVRPGSRVRLRGDGPSNWTIWLVVARTKTKAMARWGTLPGAYIMKGGRPSHIGGKPLETMLSIVSDYSREGDLVCDPCAGAATTALACLQLGRRFLGWEKSTQTYALGKQAIRALRARRQ